MNPIEKKQSGIARIIQKTYQVQTAATCVQFYYYSNGEDDIILNLKQETLIKQRVCNGSVCENQFSVVLNEPPLWSLNQVTGNE